mmetsp:Transcript_685/g.1252  ORF Transcript_685/g.1252 Transcript_685/m.1252 type:complete len:84 (-) Transcript_685:822-1073(-)
MTSSQLMHSFAYRMINHDQITLNAIGITSNEMPNFSPSIKTIRCEPMDPYHGSLMPRHCVVCATRSGNILHHTIEKSCFAKKY